MTEICQRCCRERLPNCNGEGTQSFASAIHCYCQNFREFENELREVKRGKAPLIDWNDERITLYDAQDRPVLVYSRNHDWLVIMEDGKLTAKKSASYSGR
jgi:hypothetical protein